MIELFIAKAWAAIPAFERVFWYVAIPSSLFGMFSVISALFGIGGDADLDVDVSVDGLEATEGLFGSVQYFTVKNMIMFFAVFGWVGIVCTRAGWPHVASAATAFVSGVIGAGIFAVLFKLILKLNESGTITSYQSTVGKYGTVYLPIPANKNGSGKIQIVIHSSLREIDAVTEGDELATGVKVKVTALLGENTLIVEKA